MKEITLLVQVNFIGASVTTCRVIDMHFRKPFQIDSPEF